MSLLANGAAIGGFKVVRPLGQGPLAEVYEVSHKRRRERLVAKLLKPEIAAKGQAIHLLRREAELASSLGHPHIAKVLDFGVSADGQAFVISEWLPGVTLAERIAEAAPLSILDVSNIVGQVCEALAAAEAKGVFHRNLTPRNIMLTPSEIEGEAVKVLDFGTSRVHELQSRASHDPALLGAPAYLSPEQARGQYSEVDARTDQFALAAIAYEMLCGQPAFTGENSAAILASVAGVTPRPLTELNPAIPEEMAAAIRRALSKARHDRFASGPEFFQELSRPVLGLAGSRTMRALGSEVAAVSAPASEAATAEEPARRRDSRSTGPRRVSNPDWVVTLPPDEELFRPARRSRAPALGLAAVMLGGAAVGGWAVFGTGGLSATGGLFNWGDSPPPAATAQGPGARSDLPAPAVARAAPPSPPPPTATPTPEAAPPSAAASAAAPPTPPPAAPPGEAPPPPGAAMPPPETPPARSLAAPAAPATARGSLAAPSAPSAVASPARPRPPRPPSERRSPVAASATTPTPPTAPTPPTTSSALAAPAPEPAAPPAPPPASDPPVAPAVAAPPPTAPTVTAPSINSPTQPTPPAPGSTTRDPEPPRDPAPTAPAAPTAPTTPPSKPPTLIDDI